MKLIKGLLIFLCLISISAFILLIINKPKSNFCKNDDCCVQLKKLMGGDSIIYKAQCGSACPAASTGQWDYTYFFSGGLKDGILTPYTENDVNKTTNAADIEITPNGADPSCGSVDAGCIDDDSDPPPVANADLCQVTLKAAVLEGKVTYAPENIGSYECGDKTTEGDGRIKLIGKPYGPAAGKVVTFLHGPLGDWDYANCNSTHAIGPNLAKNGRAYKQIMNICDKLNVNSTDTTGYITKKQMTGTGTGLNQCLISMDAFEAAGLMSLFDKGVTTTPGITVISPPNNDGVVLAWGHGVGGATPGTGQCGDITLIQQGTRYIKGNNAFAGNTILSIQTGMRSWSGEIGDSWTSVTEKTTKGAGMEYISQGVDVVQTARHQPIFKEIHQSDINKLWNALGIDTGDGTSPADKATFAGLMGWTMANIEENATLAGQNLTIIKGKLELYNPVPVLTFNGLWCGSGCTNYRADSTECGNNQVEKEWPTAEEWPTAGANTIALGKFQNGELYAQSACGVNYEKKWYTIGGQGMTTPLSADECYKQANRINAEYICFDMEGFLACNASWKDNNMSDGWFNKQKLVEAFILVDEIKELGQNDTPTKSFKFVFCPLGDTGPNGPPDGSKWGVKTPIDDRGLSPYFPKKNDVIDEKGGTLGNHFEYIAPMFYWGQGFYALSYINIDRIKMWIGDWIADWGAGWDPEQVILTYQSDDLHYKIADTERTQILKMLVDIATGKEAAIYGPNRVITPPNPQTNCDGSGGGGGGGGGCQCVSPAPASTDCKDVCSGITDKQSCEASDKTLGCPDGPWCCGWSPTPST